MLRDNNTNTIFVMTFPVKHNTYVLSHRFNLLCNFIKTGPNHVILDFSASDHSRLKVGVHEFAVSLMYRLLFGLFDICLSMKVLRINDIEACWSIVYLQSIVVNIIKVF